MTRFVIDISRRDILNSIALGAAARGRGWYFSGLTVDPKNAERLYVMDTIVLRSDDGGQTFHRAERRSDRR